MEKESNVHTILIMKCNMNSLQVPAIFVKDTGIIAKMD
jgi:hypothetical protein